MSNQTEYIVTLRIVVDDDAGYVHPSVWDWQALVDCADPVDVVSVDEVAA